jgi:alginate O-acetyltransferase complex protein AlgI
VLSGGELSVLSAWAALLFFAFRIDFDFSGYSDMAIGLGRTLGFTLPENFDYPYLAISFSDFWRRWHKTLSQFFRDYVYIPLGGSRHGVCRTVLSLLAVWALTGLWHGARLNFLLWGLYFFVGLLLEKFVLRGAPPKMPVPLRRALTFFGILLGWALFAFDGSAAYLSFAAMGKFWRALFGGAPLFTGNNLFDICRHLPFLAILVFGATPLPKNIFLKFSKKYPWICAAGSFVLLVLSVSALFAGSFGPFLYFRF